ncbi:hypothetical protein ACFLZX_01935 [Nanoarchaeota archaeon]
MRKKGDLNITVNAIVIIVLALTFLSLGLVFIRNIFEGITETTVTVQDQIRQQIIDDLRRGDKKLSFPADQITVGKGKERIFGIGVKNTLDEPMDFEVDVCQGDDCSIPNSADSQDAAVSFFWEEVPFKLDVNDVGVVGIKIVGPDRDDVSEIYKIKIQCAATGGGCTDGDEFASKSFFVKSTG